MLELPEIPKDLLMMTNQRNKVVDLQDNLRKRTLSGLEWLKAREK